MNYDKIQKAKKRYCSKHKLDHQTKLSKIERDPLTIKVDTNPIEYSVLKTYYMDYPI